jgi:galactitol-specific phosphotransferase system IIC component
MTSKDETKKSSPALAAFVVCCATGAGVGAAFGRFGLGAVVGANVGAALGLFLERKKMKPAMLGVTAAALLIAFALFLFTR